MEPRFNMFDNEVGATFAKRFANASLVIARSPLPMSTQELMALHIDMGVRRVTPYPAERYAALRQAVKDHAPATLPKGVGRRIAAPLQPPS